ncbi:MAG: Pyridoxine 5'-phosphate synthase [Candidatus Omnitrophica bacterium]|nr:Pyridoxine 5'-phosphate synthase [Candidatus Omnitrophota bacterium]
MAELGVNVDHIATLRQARLPKGGRARPGDVYPDPVEAARTALSAGAVSIVMHLREDRRHIQDQDLFALRRRVRGRINMEMSIAPSVVRTALRLRPDQVTLVPERRQERTTEGGLDLTRKTAVLRRLISDCRRRRIEVSLFIDPTPLQVRWARRLGAHAIELHTGDYANARTAQGRRRELARLRSATRLGLGLGLAVHAGHGLDYVNVGPVAAIPGMGELNIGYSIVARSLKTGLRAAVTDMRALIRRASRA